MTVKEMKALIPEAVARFEERIPHATPWIGNVSIKVATYQTGEKLFRATIDELNAWEKPFDPNAIAEAFVGENGFAVIVYQHRVKSKFQLFFALWHELGHICSHVANKSLEQEGRDDVLNRRDTPMASGCAVWMEFIADTIANYVHAAEPSRSVVPWSLQDNLEQMANMGIDGGNLFPAALGHYFAYLLTDADVAAVLDYYTTDEQSPSIGLDAYREEVQAGMCQISRNLYDHLDANGYFGDEMIYGTACGEFWQISRERMQALGADFDELYETCRTERLCGLIRWE